MTGKEKIRAYIERQIALLEKNDTGNPVFGVSAGVVMAELKHLLSFIDNLPEEPASERANNNHGQFSSYFDGGVTGMWIMKEEMMKNAISTIMQRDDCNDLVPTIGDMSARGFEVGDKVKVIIIKEE